MRISPLAILGLFALSTTASAGHPVPFDVQLLTVDANEGCDIGDLDGDGKLDVSAGRNWFRNGDWAARPLRTIADWNGYVESNGEFIYDVNGDGRPDVVAGSFLPSQVYWYENPGPDALRLGLMWRQHLLADTGYSQNEAAFLRDINGDGRPEWIYDSWNKTNPLLLWSFGTEPREVETKQGNKTVTETKDVPTLLRTTLGDSGNGHGMAFGDLNNDGREDIMVGTGWYERPEGDPLSAAWVWHPDWEDLHAACPCLIRDLDGDGKSDLIWAKGHDYGMYVWWGRGPDDSGKLQFETQLIDESFSQPHALEFADLDGDGQDEILSGKRFRAHNGGDPGAAESLITLYYTFDPATKTFGRHVINAGQVGIGLQIRTGDLDGDGDVEIVVAGKDGTQILWNRSK